MQASPSPPNWLYSGLLFLAALVSLVLLMVAWQRRKRVPCAGLMSLYSLTNLIWSFAYALHWTPMPRPNEFFWVDMTYLGVVFVGVAFLAFALCYTGLHGYVTKRNFFIFSIIPLLTLFFLATDPWLHIFFGDKRPSASSVIFDGGVGFWLFIIYSYSLIALSFLVILQAILRFPQKYKEQTSMILLGVFIPVMINALTFLGYSPLPELDLTPITFVLTGVFFSIAIFRYNFLDLMPISRDVVFETHRDAIFVLDLKHRVVDANEYARDVFRHQTGDSLIGSSLSSLRGYLPALPYLGLNDRDEHFELALEDDVTLEMVVSPLPDKNGEVAGFIATMRDISAQKRAEKVILKANDELKLRLQKIQALQSQLREEAIRDHLTGLYNRRYLHEVLRQYLEPARKCSRIISFALLDIDHFKQVNDTYGHDVGDEVLVNFSRFLLDNTRSDDTVCRFGGEEFMVVFANTDKTQALGFAERWLSALRGCQLSQTVQNVQISFSCGIVSFPDDGENMDSLFKKADDYLYEAKKAGRNRVIAA